jgi:hypothetical protein
VVDLCHHWWWITLLLLVVAVVVVTQNLTLDAKELVVVLVVLEVAFLVSPLAVELLLKLPLL